MTRNPIKNLAKRALRRFISFGQPSYEINEHVEHFRRCLEFIGYNGVEGDLLEFGVGGGSTLAIINNIAQRALWKKNQLEYRLFGFDSFEGMPESSGKDSDMHMEGMSGLSFDKGQFHSTEESVWKNLRKESSDIGNIKLIAGWYDDTLTEGLKESLGLRAASLINIDCDFYSSTLSALNWCENLIGQGTILSFDDWFCYKGSTNHGEASAFKEFLEENTHLQAQDFSTYSWHGKAFVMSRDE